MSLIERAVGKLGLARHRPPAPPPEPPRREPSEPPEPTMTIPQGGGAAAAAAAAAIPDTDALARSTQVRHINLERLRKAGMITPEGEKSPLAEEFRLVKRPLLANAFNKGAAPVRNGNLVMVTSSFPGEGKSFCSINLAMSIAMEMDHRVLLVDADVAKPSIPGFLGISVDKGMMDVLLDPKLDLSDVMIRTNVEKLSILPAGRPHRHATELLASEAMARLLKEMAERYQDRILIFDSPPLLATTEARALATRMGQIVVVVEANRTPQETVQESLSQLEGCDVVGLLLNKGNRLIGSDYYGAYGAYGYGK